MPLLTRVLPARQSLAGYQYAYININRFPRSPVLLHCFFLGSGFDSGSGLAAVVSAAAVVEEALAFGTPSLKPEYAQ